MQCSAIKDGVVLAGVIEDLENGDMELKVADADVPKSIVTAIKNDFLKLEERANRASELKFTTLKPVKQMQKYPTIFASYYKNREVCRPKVIRTAVLQDREFIFIGNWCGDISVFNSDYEPVGKLGIGTGNDIPYAIYDLGSFSIDAEGKKIAIASYYSHTIEVYELVYSNGGVRLGGKLGRIGTWKQGGEIGDVSLYYPTGVEWLDNGNLLVTSAYGMAKDEKGSYRRRGFVAEFSTNGDFIKTHLGNWISGMPWDMETAEVTALKRYGEYLFVSTQADMVGVFRIVNKSLVYYTTFTNNTDAGSVDPQGVALRDGKLFVTLGNTAKIAKIDFESHKIEAIFGKAEWDNTSKAKNNINSFWDVKDIEFLDDNTILVADYGNNRVAYLYQEEEEVKYELPEDLEEIVFSYPKIDKNGILKVQKGANTPEVNLVYKVKKETK